MSRAVVARVGLIGDGSRSFSVVVPDSKQWDDFLVKASKKFGFDKSIVSKVLRRGKDVQPSPEPIDYVGLISCALCRRVVPAEAVSATCSEHRDIMLLQERAENKAEGNLEDLTPFLSETMRVQHGDTILIQLVADQEDPLPTASKNDPDLGLGRRGKDLKAARKIRKPPRPPRTLRHSLPSQNLREGKAGGSDFGEGYEEDMAEMEMGLAALLQDKGGNEQHTQDVGTTDLDGTPTSQLAKPKSRKKKRNRGAPKMKVRELRFHAMELAAELKEQGIYVPPLAKTDDDAGTFDGLGKVSRFCNGKGNTRSYRKRRHRETEMVLSRLAAHYESYLTAHEEQGANEMHGKDKQGREVGVLEDRDKERGGDEDEGDDDSTEGEADAADRLFVSSDDGSGSGEGW
jgi:hypothetical protein